jgi:hypothetical protein
MFRYFVAFCAVSLGGLVALADYSVGRKLLPPEARGANGKESPEEDYKTNLKTGP